MGKPNCFEYAGINGECIGNAYFPDKDIPDQDICINKGVANRDLERLAEGKINSITLSNMLREYLIKNNRSEEANLLW